MSKAGVTRHDPIPIGEVAEPPFVRLPDPNILFAARAERLANLASGHELSPYLRFLATLAHAQHCIQEGLSGPDRPAPDVLSRAREFGMPPLDRSRFVLEPAFEAALDRLLSLFDSAAMPEAAAAALARVKSADPMARDAMVRNVLSDSIPVETLAEHVYVAAALQVHFSRLASMLDGDKLVPVGDGVCPCCGGPPVASLVVGWTQAHATRFCACSLCGTLWNYVRIKCTACGSTEGISYQEIDGGSGAVKAETCDSCRSYVKIMNQHKEAGVDPVADDVASLGLDLLVRDMGYRRASFNPFLLGY